MPIRTSLAAAVAVVLLAAAPARGAAAPRLLVGLDDPAGDADGPGSYLPPGDTEFREGDFDLRRFEARLDGDDVVLEVTLGALVRPPASTQRSNATPLELVNGIYLQNVDVYVDTDPASREGFASCIPGRRIGFADGRTWKAAVVLTPQPGAVREVVDGAMGPAASRVHVATRITSRGRTLVARVPVAFFGGAPREDWGWSVQLSGARWERTYQVVDRFRGAREVDAFTMPVTGVRESWAFGGAPPGNVHPRVVDVILPPGVDQRRVLGSSDAASGAWARVPFVYAKAPPAVAEPAPAPGLPPGTAVLTVADVSGDLVTLAGPVEGLVALQIGRVLGGDGAPVARLVVTRVMNGAAVASVADGQGKVARGAKVAFDPPAPAPSP
jgi:carbohydrate-binding DOMON domain-containing protein